MASCGSLMHFTPLHKINASPSQKERFQFSASGCRCSLPVLVTGERGNLWTVFTNKVHFIRTTVIITLRSFFYKASGGIAFIFLALRVFSIQYAGWRFPENMGFYERILSKRVLE